VLSETDVLGAGALGRTGAVQGRSAASITAHLRRPRVFSNALLAPWSPRLPGAGSPNVVALQPQFLAPTLIPSQFGGEAKDTVYFPQGSGT
jgi:hypothetical protein